MGTGCQSVKRGTTEDGKIMVTGTWEGGRTGTFREENGKDRKGYGGKAVGEKGEAEIGKYDNYTDINIDACKQGTVSGELAAAVKDGATVEGAQLSNGAPVLTIRGQ